MSDLYSLSPDEIILYGVAWCSDCIRARRIFANQGIKYTDIDIDKDLTAAEFVKKVNRGNRSVPTIVFPDGTTLTEPDNLALVQKLQTCEKIA